jgi:hypothetical protein
VKAGRFCRKPENKGDKEINLHLTVAGFFDGAKMYAGGAPEDMPVEDAI